MAEECVDCGVGVTMALAPSHWIDVATVGEFGRYVVRVQIVNILTGIVPKLSGGDIFFHPKYDPERDFVILASQIRRLVDRETGYQATLRLRCTTGKKSIKGP
jgi:protein transport protein SEC24